MKLIRAQELIGLPVVSIDTGEDLAEIRDVMYDADTNALLGFTLNEGGLFSRRSTSVLPLDAVHSVGRDAVMVQSHAALADARNREAEEGPDRLSVADVGSARPVVGHRVLSADGREIGEVVSVILDIETALKAVGYEVGVRDQTSNFYVPISAQISVSGEYLILRDDATDLMRTDLEALANVFDSMQPEQHQATR